MSIDSLDEARMRIAAQRGELRGWRPLKVGDVAVTALQVLGMVRTEPHMVGLRVVVAGRTPDAIVQRGAAVAETLLRRRAVLAPEDPLIIVSTGEGHSGEGTSDDPLRWPWTWLVIHVAERQLPAIAGLATDTVPQPQGPEAASS
jgi:hypothetical protein